MKYPFEIIEEQMDFITESIKGEVEEDDFEDFTNSTLERYGL